MGLVPVSTINMENLYCIENLQTDPMADVNLRAITCKYDDKAIAVLVWRSIESAKRYLNKESETEFGIREFSLEDFDRIKRWTESVKINLFIDIVS